MSDPLVPIHEFKEIYSKGFKTGKDVKHYVVYVYIITVGGIIRYVGESGVIYFRRKPHASNLFRDIEFEFHKVFACHSNRPELAVVMAKHEESGLMIRLLELNVELWNPEVVQASNFTFHQAPVEERRIISERQHLMLEQRFKNDTLIEGQERDEFAASLGLTVKQVRNWFMHRRARMRQEQEEEGARLGRNPFTRHQHLMLEQRFKKDIYIEGPERRELASSSALTETQVKNWFDNHRKRMRRQAGGGSGEEEKEEEEVQGQEEAQSAYIFSKYACQMIISIGP